MLNGCARLPNQNRCNMYGRSSFPMYVAIVAFILTWLSDIEGIPSRSEQCRNRGYDVACELDNCGVTENYHCNVLTCGRKQIGIVPTLKRLIPRWGVVDGTPCGPSKVCKHKHCVDVEEPVGQCAEENDLVFCVKKRYRYGQSIKTREEQCQAHGFDVACMTTNMTDCYNLQCGYSMWEGKYVWQTPETLPFTLTPSVGSRCGVNKVCVRDKCVPLSEWPGPEGSLRYTGEETFWPCDDET